VKTDVWVDGRRWRRVASFAEAGPEDDVFALDLENGRIRFGDGVNGRRPRMGAEVIVAVYRHGAGGSGDVGAGAPPIQISRSHAVDTTDLALWTVIRTQTSSIPIPTCSRGKTPPDDQCSRRTGFRLRLALAFAAGVIAATAAPRLRRE
jgi:hypothetical protein